MSVVLAEDDIDIRDLVQMVLEGLGLEVSAVCNGSDALAACRGADISLRFTLVSGAWDGRGETRRRLHPPRVERLHHAAGVNERAWGVTLTRGVCLII